MPKSSEKLELYNVPSSRVDEVALSNGQIIYTNDEAGCYYDLDGKRHALYAKPDVLYFSNGEYEAEDPEVIELDWKGGCEWGENESTFHYSKYRKMEFVYVDIVNNITFSFSINGRPINNHSAVYDYRFCNSVLASYDFNDSFDRADGSIHKETAQVLGYIHYEEDGSQKTPCYITTEKSLVEETVQGGVMSVSQHDLSEDTRIFLIGVFGWR